MKNNYLVKQSHSLNMACYELSPLALDLLHVFLAQIKEKDNDFKSFKFKITELEQKLDKFINRNSIDSITTELMTSIIYIKISETKILKTAWCSSAIFDTSDNSIELTISNNLKNSLLSLPDKFAWTDYRILSKLRGIYSKRLYLMISQFNKTGKFIISLDKFKMQLNLENKYNKYNDFKRRILTPAIKYINDNLGIDLVLVEVKDGRKIVRLDFFFDNKKYLKINKGYENNTLKALGEWYSKD